MRPPVTPVKRRQGGAGQQSLAPATPGSGSGTAEPGRYHARRLNEIYHLGLQLPDDHPRSPAEQERLGRSNSHLARQSNILQLLRLLHYRDPARLQAVISDFDGIARGTAGAKASTRAGRSAHSSVPSSPVALQESLLALLEASKAALMQGMKAQTPVRPPPVDPELSPAVAAHLPGRDVIATEIDRVHVMPSLGSSALRPATRTNIAVERWVQGEGNGHAASENDRPASSASSTASSDMYSALDSFEGVRETQETAGTTATSQALYTQHEDDGDKNLLREDDGYTTEEFDASPRLRRAPSNDSFAASDGLLEAFEESFSKLQPPPSPSVSSTSSIPNLASLRITEDGAARAKADNQKTSARSHKKSARSDVPFVPGLRERLEDVFPPTPAWLQGAPLPIIWETTRIALRCGVDLCQEPSAPPPTYTPAWEESQALFRTALAENPMFQGQRLPEPLSDVTWQAAMNRLPVIQGLGTRRVPVYMIQLHFSESGRRGSSHATPAATGTPRKNKVDDDGPLYYAQLLPIATDLPHRLSRRYGTERFLEILLPSHHSSKGVVPRILYKHDAAVQVVNAWLTRQRHEVVGRRWAAFYVKDGGFNKKQDSIWDQDTGMQPSGTKDQDKIFLKRVFLFAEESIHTHTHTYADTYTDNACSQQSISSRLQTGPLDYVTVYEMLDWLLHFNQFPKNRKQPYLKLFSRISLGLSRTKPTVVFRPDQITHHQQDLLSPTGKVMNDGIGRMSLSVARKLRSALELSDLPTAVQGRLGSAKGMWILDTEDPGKLDWIETYPSQRKWLLSHGEIDGDYGDDDSLDPNQRTLEIRHFASEIGRSSSLNLQFIPLVEDRALDKPRMRRTLARILAGHLTRDLATQRDALKHPLLLSAWVNENARFRNNYLSTYGGEAVGGQVPFLAGLPDSDEDTIQFLLAGGFHPLQQQYLWEKVYALQKARYKRLQSKLSVRIGRAAHLLMVVDFLGVLEEGEVQICFSSKFQVDADTPVCEDESAYGSGSGGDVGSDDDNGDDGSFSDTLLVGMDVLVARSPAHFPGDMQKVRAVFRPELSALKDVVIFSTKGNSPLADKLSGGDYDGDTAWVCWDPRIVNNFENAPEQQEQINMCDMGYMHKIKTTMEELAAPPYRGSYPSPSFDDLLELSFAFNMRENLLGKITSYKENLCYFRGSIGDRTAVVLSTLLGDLVDQAKQGNVFTGDDFERLRKECLGGLQGGDDYGNGNGNGKGKGKNTPAKRRPPPPQLPVPAYKQERSVEMTVFAQQVDSIIDFLKFDVADPIVERELTALENARKTTAAAESVSLSQSGDSAYGFYDMDLAAPARHFEELASRSAVCHAIFEALQSDIRDVSQAWEKSNAEWKKDSLKASRGGRHGGSTGDSSGDDPGYRHRVLRVYNQWCAIGIRLPDADAAAAPAPVPASASTPSRAPTTPRRGTPAAAHLGTPRETPYKSPFKKAPRGSVWSDAESESIPSLLKQEYLDDPMYSQWALIRASQTFRMLYRKQSKLLWNLAGRQLQNIKALATKTSISTGANPNADNSTAGAKVMMTPLMFAASKPDRKTIKRMTARLTASSLFHEDYDGDGDLFYDADDGFRLYADDT